MSQVELQLDTLLSEPVQCLYVPSALRFVPPLFAMLLRALRLFLNMSKQRLFAVLQRRQHAHVLKKASLPSATEVGGWLELSLLLSLL